jgi:hypothetical protein
MIPIRDIKPNVEIIDYYFIGFVIFLVALFIVLIFFLLKKRKNPKREIYLKLKNINFNNSKEAAYQFTKLARVFVNDENKEIYKEILNSLEKYKYKKNVPPMSEEDIKKIQNFIKEIRV